jgi:9-cis-epoxycarotenoid dioxygenase
MMISTTLLPLLFLLALGPWLCLVNSFSAKPTSILHRLDRFLDRLQKPEEQLSHHIYLRGNYAPVEEEHSNVPVEVVEGQLPKLDGIFCRNGPNPVTKWQRRKRYHWFDGHAMLHLLRFENGQAFYSNQFVPSERYRVEENFQEEFFPRLGEYSGPLGLIKVLYHPDMVRKVIPDLSTVLPPNTSCLMYQNKFYCLNEGNRPFECRILPSGRLEPVGYESFNGALNYPVSAHPRIDTNGDLLFHSYTTNTELIQRDGTMKYGKLSGDKLVSYFVPTTANYIAFAHNLLHTERYVILVEPSVHFDPAAMFDGGSYFRTKKNFSLRFAVFDKEATSRDDVVWFDTGAPGGLVHPLNAWEDGNDEIVIWTPFCDNLELDLETDDINVFNMVEFRLNTKTGQVTKQLIDDSVNVEFSIAPVMGNFTRYGYTAIQDKATPGEGSFAGFCVWDMQERKLHSKIVYERNEVGGEPILIPDETTKMDFVGVYTHDLKENQSYFLLHEGGGGSNKLVARLKMPYRIPYGFHGLWVNGEDLSAHFAYHESKSSQVSS